MTHQSDFLRILKAAAEQSGGKPLGETQFYRQHGLTRKDLWAAGYESYGEACEAAGFPRNTLTPRLSDDDLFRPLATLARAKGRFPPKGALEVARQGDPSFPSWEAFKRRERQGPEASLKAALVAWCDRTDEFVDVRQILVSTDTGSSTPRRQSVRPIVNGFVYLMRYGSGGSVYKIGFTENVHRRHSQLNMMAPQDLRIVHSIPTDDPEGIERYWFARFEPKRLQGKRELFRLSPEDVAAFKSRKYQ